jgi:hypothetical protein
MAVVLRSARPGRVPKSGVLVVAGLAAAVAVVVPQRLSATEQLIEFNIAAEPLDAALSEYGTATRIQLLFDAGLTEGRRANGVKGVFTAEAALRQLLAGTGIAARMIGNDGLTLVPEAADRGSPTVRQFAAYSAMLQDALRNALCRDRETAPGSYRALAQVWIGRSGKTDRAELLTSSGDIRRDAMLAASLRGLAIGASPPSDLPQPVTLLVTSEATGASYCPQSGRSREAGR